MPPEKRREQLIVSMGGLIAAALVVGFFAQPLMKFADPQGITWGVLFFSIGVLWSYYQYVLSESVKRFELIPFLCLLVGVFFLCLTWADALSIITHTDTVCGELEADMLSPRPRRANAPEIFEALNCRPHAGTLFLR